MAAARDAAGDGGSSVPAQPSAASAGAGGGLSPSTVELAGPFTHRFVHLRGVRLHVAAAGDVKDPLVILLHDAFGGWFDYRDVLAPLAAAGFHVVALDARGYGMSDKPPAGAGLDVLTAVGDVTALIRVLGHDSAVLVGADSGGAVAWCAATAHPGQVRALVSVAAAHPVDMRRAMAARPVRFLPAHLRAGLGRLPGAHRLPDCLAAWLQRRILDRWTAPQFHGTALYDAALDLRVRAMRIASALPGAARYARLTTSVVPPKWLGTPVTVPVLALQPDRPTFRHLARRARRRCTARMSVRELPGTARLPHVEAPGAFAAAVAAWLNELD